MSAILARSDRRLRTAWNDGSARSAVKNGSMGIVQPAKPGGAATSNWSSALIASAGRSQTMWQKAAAITASAGQGAGTLHDVKRKSRQQVGQWHARFAPAAAWQHRHARRAHQSLPRVEKPGGGLPRARLGGADGRAVFGVGSGNVVAFPA